MSLLEKIIGKETVGQLKQVSKKEGISQKELKEVKLAGLRERISAYISDILIVCLFGIIILFVPLLQLFLKLGLGAVNDILKTMEPFYFVSILYFFYSSLLIGDHGWTLGKRSAKIKVVTEDNFKDIGFLRAFLREGIKVGLNCIPYLNLLVLLLNVYLIKNTSKRQAIHDKIIGTQVITTTEVEKFRIY